MLNIFHADKDGYDISLTGDKRFSSTFMTVECHGVTGNIWSHVATCLEVSKMKAKANNDPTLSLALKVDKVGVCRAFYHEFLLMWLNQNEGLAKELMILAGSHNNQLWDEYTAGSEIDHAALLAAALVEYCKHFNN